MAARLRFRFIANCVRSGNVVAVYLIVVIVTFVSGLSLLAGYPVSLEFHFFDYTQTMYVKNWSQKCPLRSLIYTYSAPSHSS